MEQKSAGDNNKEMEIEINSDSQHQSKPSTSNTNNDDQQTSSKKRNHRRKKKNIPEKPITSSGSHEQTSSTKSKKVRPGPRLTKVLTGHPIVNKERLKDITVYDIPAIWTEEEILKYLEMWGRVIKLSTKVQRKYQTLRVQIELHDNFL